MTEWLKLIIMKFGIIPITGPMLLNTDPENITLYIV